MLTTVLYRRLEVDRALVGSDLPADRVRAIIAFGGLQDCAVLLGDAPLESYADAAVASALRALQRGVTRVECGTSQSASPDGVTAPRGTD